jgi:hypothetical protein
MREAISVLCVAHTRAIRAYLDGAVACCEDGPAADENVGHCGAVIDSLLAGELSLVPDLAHTCGQRIDQTMKLFSSARGKEDAKP